MSLVDVFGPAEGGGPLVEALEVEVDAQGRFVVRAPRVAGVLAVSVDRAWAERLAVGTYAHLVRLAVDQRRLVEAEPS